MKASTSAKAKPQDPGILDDPRFAHLVSDPRFKNIHKSTRSVKIDNRFKSMFNDDQFKVKYTVDKYGRRVNKSSTNDLEKYYDLSSDEDDEEEEKRKEEAELVKESIVGDNDDLHSDEEITTDVRDKLKDLNVDYARGEAALWSDSSSDDESEGDDQELFIEHVWGELDNDAPRTEESTNRLAACNMDWDRIRASDIMVLCNSFLPPGGSIVRVAIYPSEYGKERMAEEEVKGPRELTLADARGEEGEDTESDHDDDEVGSNANSDQEEGDDYHMEKLRQYQLNRLKYYYAVIECNNVRAADKLYQECDGLEYESTATKLDLRFIPDDMEFDDEPKDVCTELPELTKYKPRLFTTTALQQAKVELTWDENDVDRKELADKLFSKKAEEISDADLRKYVAQSSSDEDDQPDEQPSKPKSGKDRKSRNQESNSVEDDDGKPAKDDMISVYKDLLKDINEKESEKKKKSIEMEMLWNINPSKKGKDLQLDETRQEELTPFEKIIEKKRAKKKARKEEIKKLKKAQKGGGDASGNSESDEDLPDGIDLNDPYFAEEFANGEFEEVKKPSKTAQKKLRKNKNKGEAGDESDDQRESELALLLNDDDHRAHFSLKKIQENENDSKTRKRKKQMKTKRNTFDEAPQQDDFELNVSDNRFSAIYSSHLFNIDPTDSHYRKTKAMETLIHEKLKRKPNEFVVEDVAVEPETKKPKKDVALNILVKNIKRKVKQQS